MRPRRRRPRGHIKKLPSGNFQARVYAGIDPLTRKARYLLETAPDYDSAIKAITKLQRQVDEVKHPKLNIPVRQAVEQRAEVGLEDTIHERYDDSDRSFGGMFGSRAVRVWTVVAGIVTIAALIVAILQLLPKSARAQLELQRFEVTDSGQVGATIFDVSDPSSSPTPGQVESSKIDVTLRNTGETAVFLSSVEFTLLYVEEMYNCKESGGEIRASANYSVTVPASPPPLPFTVSQDISFQVEPGLNDRLTFTVGPAQQSLSSEIPLLYVVDVALKYSDSSEPFRVGTAAVMSRPGSGQEQLATAIDNGDYACAERNSMLLNKMYEIPTVRSPDLEDLKQDFINALSPDPEPARAVCGANEGREVGIRRACFTFTKRQLTAGLSLSQNPTPGKTQVMIRISATGSGDLYSWVASYQEDGWQVGYIDEYDPLTLEYAGSGCFMCTIVGEGRDVSFSGPPGTRFSSNKLLVSAELQDASDPSQPITIASVPTGARLMVVRGA